MISHTVRAFDAELAKLTALVVDMGALVATQVIKVTAALNDHDEKIAQSVVEIDSRVDALQMRIEDMVVKIIAKRQPVAVDLREAIGTMKIATDLERMGDLAKNNAKRIMATRARAVPNRMNVNFDRLAEMVGTQLADVMQSYARRDAGSAEAVWKRDSEIDALHTSLFRELLTYMMEDPRSIGHCTHLLFCAKNLERVGDHATNIAEHVNYIVTGRFLSGDRPRGPGLEDIDDGGAR